VLFLRVADGNLEVCNALLHPSVVCLLFFLEFAKVAVGRLPLRMFASGVSEHLLKVLDALLKSSMLPTVFVQELGRFTLGGFQLRVLIH
jgi:hypothetical protein